MIDFDDVDVMAAGMACALGAELPGGSHLSRRQCAAVLAINARLSEAEQLIRVAADSLTDLAPDELDELQGRLLDFARAVLT